MFNPFEELQARLIRVEVLLLELQSLSVPTTRADQQIGGIELAVQMTGLAKSTVYNLVSESRIPHMKRGKKLYFSRTDLESWLREGKQPTVEDLQAEVDTFLTKKGQSRR